MKYIVGLIYIVPSDLSFLEQSAFSFMLKINSSEKSSEIFMIIMRLTYLSDASRITFIAIIVWEIQKSQGDASVLSATWNSFGCAPFSTNLTAEFGKVFYMEVVEN
jgi:hypothetical protein